MSLFQFPHINRQQCKIYVPVPVSSHQQKTMQTLCSHSSFLRSIENRAKFMSPFQFPHIYRKQCKINVPRSSFLTFIESNAKFMSPFQFPHINRQQCKIYVPVPVSSHQQKTMPNFMSPFQFPQINRKQCKIYVPVPVSSHLQKTVQNLSPFQFPRINRKQCKIYVPVPVSSHFRNQGKIHVPGASFLKGVRNEASNHSSFRTPTRSPCRHAHHVSDAAFHHIICYKRTSYFINDRSSSTKYLNNNKKIQIYISHTRHLQQQHRINKELSKPKSSTCKTAGRNVYESKKVEIMFQAIWAVAFLQFDELMTLLL